MTVTHILIIAAGTAVLIVLLVVMVAVRKARRDRREAGKSLRRSHYVTALDGTSDDRAGVLADVTGDSRAQTDLVAILTRRAFDPRAFRVLTTYGSLRRDLVGRTRSRRPVERGTAVLLLNLFRDPAGTGVAVAALRDPDPDVRLVGARSLALVGSPESAQALIEALQDRCLAWERIVERLAAPWALQACLAALRAESDKSQRDPDLRSNLARALGLIGDAAAEPELIRMLESGTVEERVNATRSLGQVGTQRSVAVLERELEDPSDVLRAQAATALGLIGSRDSIPALTKAMTDRGWWVRSNAASALARMGEPGKEALVAVANGTDRFGAQRAAEQLVLLEHA